MTEYNANQNTFHSMKQELRDVLSLLLVEELLLIRSVWKNGQFVFSEGVYPRSLRKILRYNPAPHGTRFPYLGFLVV